MLRKIRRVIPRVRTCGKVIRTAGSFIVLFIPSHTITLMTRGFARSLYPTGTASFSHSFSSPHPSHREMETATAAVSLKRVCGGAGTRRHGAATRRFATPRLEELYKFEDERRNGQKKKTRGRRLEIKARKRERRKRKGGEREKETE